ncbi:MAG TPA: hypothetical protein DCM40_41815, partial [Maribacter sp.]|nr:hypothetical protein [Maribacter sp.]
DTNFDFFENGGAYGLFLFHSGSDMDCGDGKLAAVFYLEDGTIALSGNVRGGMMNNAQDGGDIPTASVGAVIGAGSDGLFTAVVSGSDIGEDKIKFTFDETSDNYIRKKFNTNPQLGNEEASDFYPATSEKSYWLGETFEAFLRDGINDLDGSDGGPTGVSMLTASHGVILAIQNTAKLGPHRKQQESREGVAGWFIGQDLGAAGSYVPFNQQKLFRLKGRGHGAWLHKNAKVQIDRIRAPASLNSDYGTFSLVLRDINDTDANVIVYERFDNLTLDPTSVNFIARRIGDKYNKWDATNKQLKEYGEYDNQSNFIYVEMNSDVEAGATDASLLPFGYFGPPKFTDCLNVLSGTYEFVLGEGRVTSGFITGAYGSAKYGAGGAVEWPANKFGVSGEDGTPPFLSGGNGFGQDMPTGGSGNLTGSLLFPKVRIRNSASDGGLSDPTNAYFGFQTTQQSESTSRQTGIFDAHNLLYTDFPDDPVTTGWRATAGVDAWSYVFSLDDVVSGSDGYFYVSGARAIETAVTTGSLEDLLEVGYNRFTAPFWGGHDGF